MGHAAGPPPPLQKSINSKAPSLANIQLLFFPAYLVSRAENVCGAPPFYDGLTIVSRHKKRDWKQQWETLNVSFGSRRCSSRQPVTGSYIREIRRQGNQRYVKNGNFPQKNEFKNLKLSSKSLVGMWNFRLADPLDPDEGFDEGW